MSKKLLCYLLFLSLPFVSMTLSGATLVVCPDNNLGSTCQYQGNQGIQQAVDAANHGDVIQVRAGNYSPESFRDTSYTNDSENLVIRGYVTIDNKRITIIGEDGVILDGHTGTPTSAFVINNANVEIKNLTIRDFRVASTDDDLYDGHGIFIINSKVKVNNVAIDRIKKMGLSIRQDSTVDVFDLRVSNSHIGIWIRENSRLHLMNSLIVKIDGTGIAAYSTSSSLISHSVFSECLDDGIYASEQAEIVVNNSIITNNKPHGIAADGDSKIEVDYSIVYGNDKNHDAVSANSQVDTGSNVFVTDPKLNEKYLPLPESPVVDKGDPNIRDFDGSRPDIGLYHKVDI